MHAILDERNVSHCARESHPPQPPIRGRPVCPRTSSAGVPRVVCT
jgi:hypothetical protein